MNATVLLLATEILVPSFSHQTVNSAEDAVQADRAVISHEGVLHKAGATKLTMPSAKMLAVDRKLAVDAGTLELGFGDSAGTAPGVPALPETLIAKALLWVSAKDAERIVATGGEVSAWYDHRESDNASPSHAYAVADTTYSSGANPTVENIGTDGAPTNAIYFGGCQSGRAMRWKTPSGSNYADADRYVGVQQTFAVHCITNTQGQIFTRLGYLVGDFRRTYVNDKANNPASTMSSYILYSDSNFAPMVNGRFYIDGVRTDGTVTTPKTGLQLYEYIPFRQYNWNVDSFYSGDSAQHSGGDFLCEAMVFTNKLNETERMQVTEYLMRKWGLGSEVVNTAVDIASGAKLAVGTADGEAARLNLSGSGTVEKSGDGAFVYRSYESPRFDGVVEVKGGSAVLQAASAVKIAAGQRITATMPAAGRTVTVSSLAESDAVVKDGDSEVTVLGMPDGVRKLTVAAGTLNVASRKVSNSLSRTGYEIPVSDGSFENAAAIISAKGGGDPKCYYSMTYETGFQDAYNLGWRRCNNNCITYLINWPAWTSKGIDSASRNAWSQYMPPPDGQCYIAMKCAGSSRGGIISKPLTLTEAGTYEISFAIGRRFSSSYLGVGTRIGLVSSSSASSLNDASALVFGSAAHTSAGGFRTCKVRRANVPAGTYCILIEALSGADIARSGDIGLVTIDDVRLAKVPDDPREDDYWQIPGGDFENLLNGVHSLTFTTNNTHPNWTITQPSSWTSGTLPRIGLASLGANDSSEVVSGWGGGVVFSDSRAPDNNSWELAMLQKDSMAETTFTPPAGTWQVQGFFARLGSYGCWPAVTVYLKIGDGEYREMRRICPTYRFMMRMAMTDGFTVDGETPVTLKLLQTTGDGYTGGSTTGVLVDDLVLAKATDLELFAYDENNLTTSTARKLHRFVDSKGSAPTVRHITEAPGILGADAVEGNSYISVLGQSGLYEDVDLPFAGRYSFSFYNHSRLGDNKYDSYGYNDLKVWAVDLNGVTNVLGYVDNRSDKWVQETFEFEISTPGLYRFGIQGTQTAGSSREAEVDAISLKQVASANRTAPFAANARISVAAGARLGLDFAGTNTVESLRLGGRLYSGVVEVSDHPDCLTGTGAFLVIPRGSLLMIK